LSSAIKSRPVQTCGNLPSRLKDGDKFLQRKRRNRTRH
jgi:hypothetical protein